MATSYAEVSKLLGELSLKHQFDEERKTIVLFFKTMAYKNDEGRNTLLLVIRLHEDGEFFELFAPKVYSYKDGPHKLAVLQTCLMVSWRTKMIQFEYDEEDGEIRAVIEFPLEDASLTKKQLERMIYGMVQLIDDHDASFRAAMETGKISVPEGGGTLAQLLELLEALKGASPGVVKEVIEKIKKRTEAGPKPPVAL